MLYRLLRDHRETGPFTQSQLIDQGLKPNDLVRVDGSSEVWNYPTEIEALKTFVEDDSLHLKQKNQCRKNQPFKENSGVAEGPAMKYSQFYDGLKMQYKEKFLELSTEEGKSKKKSSVLTPILLSLPVLILEVVIGVNWKNQTETATSSVPALERASGIFDTRIYDNLENTISLTDTADIIADATSMLKDSADSKAEAVPVQKISFAAEKNIGFSRRNINDVVAVKASYKNTSAGIKNVKLDVSNLSYLHLDLVVLDLYYLDDKNGIVEKETIYLKDIDSRAKQSVDAPNGSRQTIKIRYKVSLVSAKAANLHLVNR